MPHFEIHGIRWKLVYLWIIIFTVLTFYGLHQSRDTASHNRRLIIQTRTLGLQNHTLNLQNKRLALKAKVLASQTRILSLEGVQAHAALCSLRNGLQKQVNNTKAFLLTHPNGIPGLVTRTSIVASISTQQATIDSLDILRCK